MFFHLLFIIQARDGPGWIHIPRLRIPGNLRLDSNPPPPGLFPPLPATLWLFPLPFLSVSFYACSPFPFLFNAVLPLIASSCLLLKPLALALLPSHLPTFSYDPPSSQTIAGCLFLTQISLIFPAALPLCSSNRSFINTPKALRHQYARLVFV